MDAQSGFLFNFADGGILKYFANFNEARGEGPATRVWVMGAALKDNLAVALNNHTNRQFGIFKVDKGAPGANGADPAKGEAFFNS